MRRVFLFYQFAFELHGRREFLVFGGQLVFQQEEFLDLLNPRKLLVHPVNLALDQCLHLGRARERRVVTERHIAVLGKLLHVFLVNHDDDGEVRALVANHHGIGDVGREFQVVFQFAGRDVFATGRDDDVFHAVGDLVVAVSIHRTHITRVQPAVFVESLCRLLRLVQVAGKHVLAAHHQLAGDRVKADLVEAD